MLAPSLNPKDIFLAKYDINSIITNKGKRAKGQPDGTNKEKNSKPCLLNPNIVAPRTIVKLKENVNAKWLVEAKLYGTIPIKLFNNIKTKITNIKGKYAWPLLLLICPTTIPCTVAYIDSPGKDHPFETTLDALLDKRNSINTKKPPIVKYKPIFVKDIEKLPKTGAFKEIKFLISNWSKGLKICVFISIR